mmetsp:Transcript_61850/g.201786  ORF Transcript_61850/g.201786 Transcript_61850/m.201786 type:complete len:185 (-) Transcript_61850:17-571(-)
MSTRSLRSSGGWPIRCCSRMACSSIATSSRTGWARTCGWRIGTSHQALLPHFPSLGFLSRQAPERPLQPSGCGARARLHVAGCHIPSWSSALVGWYARHGDFRGRPMYRQCDREGRGGSLVIFFCSEGQGSKWAGWCLGPEHRWECWARHEDTNALTPPQRGWRLPENGPVDETLVLSFELCSG